MAMEYLSRNHPASGHADGNRGRASGELHVGRQLEMTWRALLLVVLTCVCIPASPVGAQSAPTDPGTARGRVQFGPLGLTPSVALANLGIDTNVFNDVDDPKSDFTFTVSPQVDASLRVRRARLQVKARSDLVYFHQYSSERSADTTVDSKLEFLGTRITPWVGTSVSSGRQRFGYEIDLRLRRVTRDAEAGVEARFTRRTHVVVSAHRTQYEYDGDAVLLGTSVQEVLNRRSESVGLDLRYRLTALTTLVASTQTIHDRFEFTPSRNTNSVRLEAGLDLTPFALISGRGRVGYRALNGHGTTPDYSGLVADVAASSTIKRRTRVDVAAERDVNYSIEFAYPYFLLTGATVVATPRLTRRWDTQARIGVQRLAYRGEEGISDLLRNRIDRIRVIGVGVGYLVGRDMRIGFNVNRERRESPVQRRDYLGYRTGISVTYGR